MDPFQAGLGSSGSRCPSVGRALSLNSLSFVSSCWEMIPSAMEWETPCFQPSSRAWLTVFPVPVGAADYLCQGEPEGFLVELV